MNVYWMYKMPLAVGKGRDITKDNHGLENQEEGMRVLRGHLSLSLLNLLPVFPCVGSSTILQYFFSKSFTLQYTAYAILQIMPDTSSVSCWKITILSNCNPDFRLFQTFWTETHLSRYRTFIISHRHLLFPKGNPGCACLQPLHSWGTNSKQCECKLFYDIMVGLCFLYLSV